MPDSDQKSKRPFGSALLRMLTIELVGNEMLDRPEQEGTKAPEIRAHVLKVSMLDQTRKGVLNDILRRSGVVQHCQRQSIQAWGMQFEQR